MEKVAGAQSAAEGGGGTDLARSATTVVQYRPEIQLWDFGKACMTTEERYTAFGEPSSTLAVPGSHTRG